MARLMIVLDTFAALLECDHALAAFCPACQRWSDLDLARLVASGRGGETFIGRRPRCQVCGSLGLWQLRPPTMRGTASVIRAAPPA